MLKKDATQYFFSALAHVSSDHLGQEADLSLAARNATENPSPTAFVRAQEELARLTDDAREKILRDIHARLRNDIGLIWENLPNAPTSARPN